MTHAPPGKLLLSVQGQ